MSLIDVADDQGCVAWCCSKRNITSEINRCCVTSWVNGWEGLQPESGKAIFSGNVKFVDQVRY